MNVHNSWNFPEDIEKHISTFHVESYKITLRCTRCNDPLIYMDNGWMKIFRDYRMRDEEYLCMQKCAPPPKTLLCVNGDLRRLT